MGRVRTAFIVGGGVIGVTSAYALACDGWKVRIFDTHDRAGMGATFGNGRQLSYSHTNALASPDILKQIPKLIFGLDPAFRLRLTANPAFLNWAIRFLSNCSATINRRNTLETLALAEKSREALQHLLERHPISFDHTTAGKMVLLRSEEDVSGAKSAMQAKIAHGLDQKLLSRDEAIDVEPTLAQSPEPIAGALFSPSDATGNCIEFTQKLLEILTSMYDVEYFGKSTVQTVERHGSETLVTLENGSENACDLVVITAGHFTTGLTRKLGYHLPIEPMKGYSFTAPLGNAAPSVSITDPKRRIVFTNIGDRMLVAGIAEIGGLDRKVDQKRLDDMADAASASLPEAAVYSQRDEGWAGFRPMTPNSQPITRMLEPGIAVNSGHGMLGWTLAMGSAVRLAEIVWDAA